MTIGIHESILHANHEFSMGYEEEGIKARRNPNEKPVVHYCPVDTSAVNVILTSHVY